MPRRLTPALLLLALACRSDKAEDRVRKAFEGACGALKEGDAAGATEALSKDFRGPEGLDKASARFLLQGIFRQGKVGLTVLRNDLSAQGSDFDQEVELLLTQTSGGLLPTDAGRRHYLLRWRKEEGSWRIARIEEIR